MGYYNIDIKTEFINAKINANKSYINAYDRLFKMAMPLEVLHGKDLCEFTKEDLLSFFKSVSKGIKYSSALTYNSLIKNYKEWCEIQKINVVEGICNVKDLNSIKTFKQYVILNEDDILNITERASIDGADFNAVIFIKLFWEIDGKEGMEDILKLKIEDVNKETKILKINRSTYVVSDWLVNIIHYFATLNNLVFAGRQGAYRILTAIENDGYVFRATYNKNTVKGQPIESTKFANILYQYSERKLTSSISTVDLLMSMALRVMVKEKKTNTDMYIGKRYFNSISSSVYADMFNMYAQKKYPVEYKEYVGYIQYMEGLVFNK
jgi:hypothetical protein